MLTAVPPPTPRPDPSPQPPLVRDLAIALVIAGLLLLWVRFGW